MSATGSSQERASAPADDGVDVTLIHWMLSLSPGERLDVLQGFADSVAELTNGNAAEISRRPRSIDPSRG